MKVTAILPDEIIKDVQQFTGGKNITESLIRALEDWLYKKRLDRMNEKLAGNPLQFKEDFSAEIIRKRNNRL
jgi:hypothetical protein